MMNEIVRHPTGVQVIIAIEIDHQDTGTHPTDIHQTEDHIHRIEMDLVEGF